MQSDFESWSSARSLCATDASERQAQRLWERVDRSGDCWLWPGATNRAGYGILGIGPGKRKRPVLAHRMAYALAVGPLPARAYVLHSCDTPACLRPTHLSIGSHAKNMDQKMERKRQAVLRGEDNPRAVLTEDVVQEIRTTYAQLRYGQKAAFKEQMAERYGVTTYAIRAVVNRESWFLSAGADAVREGLGI